MTMTPLTRCNVPTFLIDHPYLFFVIMDVDPTMDSNEMRFMNMRDMQMMTGRVMFFMQEQ